MSDRVRNADGNRTPVAEVRSATEDARSRNDMSDFAPGFGSGAGAGENLTVPSGENWLRNGGFESANILDGWTTTGVTSSSPNTTFQTEGLQSLQLNKPAGGILFLDSDPMEVVPGLVYQASVDCFPLIIGIGDGAAVLFIKWLDVVGTQINTGVVNYSSNKINDWNSMTVTDVAPEGAVTGQLTLECILRPTMAYLIDNGSFGPGVGLFGYVASANPTIKQQRTVLSNILRLFSGHTNELLDAPGRIGTNFVEWSTNQDDDQLILNISGSIPWDRSPEPSIELWSKSKSGTFVNRAVIQARTFIYGGLSNQTATNGTLADFSNSATVTYQTAGAGTIYVGPEVGIKTGVMATVTGYMSAIVAAQTLRVRIGISLDGGSTWDTSQELQAFVGSGGQVLQPFSISHAIRGLPTNDIQVRLQTRTDGGTPANFSFKSLQWNAMTNIVP